MTKEELLLFLKEMEAQSYDDEEIAHQRADKALLDFINDSEITEAFDAIRKWYA